MARFKHYDYNQQTMVVINYLEQLQLGTFEFALHYLISEKLDLSAFHKPYKNDAEGRPAYDPAILLKIILFAYSKGITSSREIQVLLVCDEQGLLGHELFAIDGCKMRSNAAKAWSGTFKELEQKRQKLKRLISHHLTEHQKKDSWESEEELDRAIRQVKTILTLDKAASKIDAFLKNNEPRLGKGKRSNEVKSNITDNQSAKMTSRKSRAQHAPI